MKNITDWIWKDDFEGNKDDLLPMEEWDGSCWKTIFDALAKLAPDADPWDSLAAFIKLTLMKGE